jgi:WW domain
MPPQVVRVKKPSNTPTIVDPTDTEVADYAKWLGITDSTLFWIAKQALTTPIPAPWIQCYTDDGDMFFHNQKTKESAWDHPMDSWFKEVLGKFNKGEMKREELEDLVKLKKVSPTPTKPGSILKGPKESNSKGVSVMTPIFSGSSINTAPPAPVAVEQSVAAAPSLVITPDPQAAAPALTSIPAPASTSISFPEENNPSVKILPLLDLKESLNSSSPPHPHPSEPNPIINTSYSSLSSDAGDSIPTTSIRLTQSVQSSVDGYKHQINDLKQRLHNILTDLKFERNNNTNLIKELERTTKELNQLTSETSNMKQENSMLSADLSVLKHNHEETSSRLGFLNKKSSEQEDSLQKARTEYEQRKISCLRRIHELMDQERLTQQQHETVVSLIIKLKQAVISITSRSPSKLEGDNDISSQEKKKKSSKWYNVLFRCGASHKEVNNITDPSSSNSGSIRDLLSVQIPVYKSRVSEILNEMKSILSAPLLPEKNLDEADIEFSESDKDSSTAHYYRKSGNLPQTSRFAPPSRNRK